MSELKPCPFCGGEARAFKRTCDKDTRYDPADRAFPIVRCGGCGACSEGDDWSELQTAIERWNRRAQPAQVVPVLTDAEMVALWQQQGGDVVCNFGRAVEQSVRAKMGVAGWQPIETAPKDGSIFLCWVTAERYGETDEGQQYAQDVSQADFGWWRPGGDAGYFDCGCGQIGDREHISHWMPLPPPPGIVGKEGA